MENLDLCNTQDSQDVKEGYYLNVKVLFGYLRMNCFSSDIESIPDDFSSFLDEQMPALEFTCDYCPQSFHMKFDLDLHKATHSKDGVYSCIVCKKIFASKPCHKKYY